MGWYTNSERTSYDSNTARIVEWPEGAPCQADVPHAGALVGVAGWPGSYKVVSGIPVMLHDSWCLSVINTRYHSGYHLKIAAMSPWHDDDTPCWNEEHVRKALVRAAYKTDEYVIDYLKEGECP